MKNVVLLLLLFLIGKQSASQTIFEKIYDGGHDDFATDVKQTLDGGYVFVGYTGNLVSGVSNACLIKTDSFGDTLWTKVYNSTEYGSGSTVQQTSDSGYIICAEKKIPLGYFVYLIKTNAAGDTLWTRTFGKTAPYLRHYVQQTADGGYVVASMHNANDNYTYLIRTDVNGDTLWTKNYEIENNWQNAAHCVHQTYDGGFIVTGYTYFSGIDKNKEYLLKVDSIGNVLWLKTFGGGTNASNDNFVSQTADSGFIVSGYIYDAVTGYNVYLVKTDINGDTLWTRTFNGAGGGSGKVIQQTFDGGYIISCEKCLIKTDVNGDTLWTRTFGNVDGLLSVQQTIDSGYILCGWTQRFGTMDILLFKTDVNGNTLCSQSNASLSVINLTDTIMNRVGTVIDSVTNISYSPFPVNQSNFTVTNTCTVNVSEISSVTSVLTVAPNPFSNELVANSSEILNGEIILLDIMGKEILRQTILGRELKINTEKISSGFYLLHYSDGKTNETLKVTKQ